MYLSSSIEIFKYVSDPGTLDASLSASCFYRAKLVLLQADIPRFTITRLCSEKAMVENDVNCLESVTV
jgi:hypothetical protein